MKDNELRERLDDIERKLAARIDSAVALMSIDVSRTEQKIDDTIATRLARIQECVEASRRFEPGHQEQLDIKVAIIIGMVIGTVIFVAGMWASFILR